MHVASVVAACLYLVATIASAQYPARGNPDPAFNGGKLRVDPFSDPAGGVDNLISVAPLSSVRFVAAGQRPNEANDFVAIVDTTPERVVSFDTDFGPRTTWQVLMAATTVGSNVVLAGALSRPGDPVRGVVQVRGIGLKSTPSYDARGTLEWTSTDAQRMDARSTAVAARAGPNGTARIWHARSQFDDQFTCGHSIVQRLDHTGTALVERGSVDLAAALSRVCMVVYYAIPHDPLPSDPPNAEAVVVGASCRDVAGSVVYFCFARILDVNGALSIDPNFGASGLGSYGAGSGFNYLVRDIRADAATRLVVALDKAESTGALAQITGVLLSLDPTGRVDTTFGAGGTLDIPSGGVNRVGGLAVGTNGTLQAVGGSTAGGVERPYVFYLDPATRQQQFSRIDVPASPAFTAMNFYGVVPLAAGGAVVVGAADSGASVHSLMARMTGDRQTVDLVEYFHAAFGHYFLASVLAEIVKLDDGTFAGWDRTGESFAVYPTGAAGVDDVCRFFSSTFAPRSSHFYTPVASECESLKTGGVWGYEGLVFALQNAPTGVCPPGTRNLHRLYNNGLDGAPNHRYTVNGAIRVTQAAQGWTEEGNGTPPVFACVPT